MDLGTVVTLGVVALLACFWMFSVDRRLTDLEAENRRLRDRVARLEGIEIRRGDIFEFEEDVE